MPFVSQQLGCKRSMVKIVTRLKIGLEAFWSLVETSYSTPFGYSSFK